MNRKWTIILSTIVFVAGLTYLLLNTHKENSLKRNEQMPKGWLGLTINEIQQQVGDSELRDDPNPRFSDKRWILLVRNKDGIDITQFTFLKEQGPMAKCLSVMFLHNQGDHKINPKNTEKLLNKCYGHKGEKSLQRVAEENISNGISTNDVWKIIWVSPQGEQAQAEVMAIGGKKWFTLICDSKEYPTFQPNP